MGWMNLLQVMAAKLPVRDSGGRNSVAGDIESKKTWMPMLWESSLPLPLPLLLLLPILESVN